MTNMNIDQLESTADWLENLHEDNKGVAARLREIAFVQRRKAEIEKGE